MLSADDLLNTAHLRAAQAKLPYRGALTPHEAHQLLQSLPNAVLVDIRTQAELDWVGRIPGSLEIEWNRWPGGVPNADFLTQLSASVKSPETPLFFVCRSGARSHNAAMAAAGLGFTACYNVLEGFEGDLDAAGHRGQVGGWRHAGLPWRQS